jgi:hypothetical protein
MLAALSLTASACASTETGNGSKVGASESAAAAASDFASAKRDWQQGAMTVSARQGQYWREAAVALRRAGEGQPTRASEYHAATAALDNLAPLPDADDSAQQRAEATLDIALLDRVFSTPDLYG